MVFAPAAWVAIAFWLLRAFPSQMDVPTSQSYTSSARRLWTATSATVPFVAGATVKIAYDPALWRLFRSVKPPEEAAVPARRSARSSGPLGVGKPDRLASVTCRLLPRQ
jgi:hypothetical protein